jgi:hypothetical protein
MRKLVLKMSVAFDGYVGTLDGDVGKPGFAFIKMLINTSAALLGAKVLARRVLLVPLDAARVSVEVIRTSGAESQAESQA